MANNVPLFVVIGHDNHGNPAYAPIVNTGLTDPNGNPLVGTIQYRGAVSVSPVDQASTNGYLDVAGSIIDSLFEANVSYTILNNGGNSITWKVLADNDPAFGSPVQVKAPAAIAAAATDTYAVAPAPYRFYKVQIIDTVGGSHGQSHLFGIAKG